MVGTHFRYAGPGETRVRCSFRIVVEEDRKKTLSLKELVEVVLMEVLSVQKTSIVCLQDFRSGDYILTLDGMPACQTLVKILNESGEHEKLKGIVFVALYSDGEVSLVVHCFNPFMPRDNIDLFLGRYCTDIKFSHKVKNECGIWTGKYKFLVKFKKDPSGPGGLHYPPSSFNIGRDRCYLFFPGMPNFCRRCHRYGHLQEDCKGGQWCSRCTKHGHSVRDCKEQMRCNVCGEEGHAFSKCPRKAEGGVSGQVAEIVIPVPEEPSPTTEPGTDIPGTSGPGTAEPGPSKGKKENRNKKSEVSPDPPEGQSEAVPENLGTEKEEEEHANSFVDESVSGGAEVGVSTAMEVDNESKKRKKDDSEDSVVRRVPKKGMVEIPVGAEASVSPVIEMDDSHSSDGTDHLSIDDNSENG